MTHPEFQAVGSHDFCQKGLVLCPSHPDVMEHLQNFWGTFIDGQPHVAGFILWGGDPGGSDCAQCRSHGGCLEELVAMYHELIRKKRPKARVPMVSWYMSAEDVERLSESIQKDITVLEPPLIHSIARPIEEHVRRIETWQKKGFDVNSRIEVQENPTYLLPPCYPKRIGSAESIVSEYMEEVFGRCLSAHQKTN